MPHVLAGAKFEQAWGKVSGVVGYDSNVEEFAGKLRLDVKFNEMFSAWFMGGYQSGYDNDFDPVTGAVDLATAVTGSVHGKAIGQLGAVSPPRLPTRQPSTRRLLGKTKAHRSRS